MESDDLQRLEEIIRAGFVAYMRSGMALQEIKERELFKPAYETFGDYLSGVWGISQSYARRLAVAYQCISNIVVPIGHVVNPPAKERIVRELVGLEPELAGLTLLAAQISLPAGKSLTYSHVAATRNALEEISARGAVEIEGQHYAVADLLTAARPELLQSAIESAKRQQQHIEDNARFNVDYALKRIIEKATPDELLTFYQKLSQHIERVKAHV